MTERSARFALPFILPGQAQKELFHNEALAVLDGLVNPAVLGIAATAPSDPELGDCWLVLSDASGSFADHPDALACYTAGGWRFVAPTIGMSVWDIGSGFSRRWTGSAWTDGELVAGRLQIEGQQVVGPREVEVMSPTGGTIVDLEARAAIDALIVTLKSHGLTD